jgi:tRNA(Ile)-lysidine synthase
MPNRPISNPPWIGKLRDSLSGFRGASVVVAVSGGADSVGLLRALHRLAAEHELDLTVAHLNHGVRGPAGDEDARFVATLADRLALPFVLGHWAPKRAGHFESDARRARMIWLADCAAERGATLVALGHTRDDQAETILHRILRGTGPHGLAGMPQQRPLAPGVTLIRPLLDVPRSAIRAWLAELGQDFREDASNTDVSRTRARLRHDLLPKLAHEYNPRVADAIVRLGNLAREENTRVRRRLARAWRITQASATPQRVFLARPAFDELPIALRAELVRLAWRRAGWPERGMSAKRWLRVATLDASTPQRFAVGHGIDALVSDNSIELTGTELPEKRAVQSPVALRIPGEVNWKSVWIVASLEEGHASEECIDLAAIEPWTDVEGAPYLLVDEPHNADRFEPLGMNGHGMPLNDFLRGRSVAKAGRIDTPIIKDRAGIIWVAGHRIADRVKRTSSTARVLGLWLEMSRPLD